MMCEYAGAAYTSQEYAVGTKEDGGYYSLVSFIPFSLQLHTVEIVTGIEQVRLRKLVC